MSICAVLINFRTPELTLRSIEALVPELASLPGARALVVDNDSGDGSFERLRDAVRERGFEDRVEIVASGRNGGFAFGVNVGARSALAATPRPSALYLLNSDAFPAPGSLRALVEYQAAHPEAAIVGSYIHGTDGTPHGTAFRFPTWQGEFFGNLRLGILRYWGERYRVALDIPTVPTRVDWLAGASMLIRLDVFERIGLFDDGFFLYFEETDFCRRAADAGFETWYVPESRVAHVGSASTGFQDASRPRARYWFESRQRYLRKHFGAGYQRLADLGWIASFLVWRLRRRVRGLPDQDPPRLLRDFVRHAASTFWAPAGN